MNSVRDRYRSLGLAMQGCLPLMLSLLMSGNVSASPAYPATWTLAVQVQVQEPDSAARRILTNDRETLPARTSVEFHVRVDRDAYVYVIDYSEQEYSSCHYPEECQPRLTPARGEVKVPEQGRLVIPKAAGIEHLVILASPVPLEAAQAAPLHLPISPTNQLASERRATTRGGNKTAPPPPQIPPKQPAPPREPIEGRGHKDRAPNSAALWRVGEYFSVSAGLQEVARIDLKFAHN